MNLTDHFTLEEMIASREAAVHSINNYPPPAIIDNLKRTAAVLELVRKVLNFPLHINSGYRSPEVNQLVGGAKNSAHMDGLAADVICPQFGDPIAVAGKIMQSSWVLDEIDQLIYEYGSWVHVGLAKAGDRPRKQILTCGHHTCGKYVPGIFGA